MIPGTIVMPARYARQNWSGVYGHRLMAYIPQPEWDHTAHCVGHDTEEFFAPDIEWSELTQDEQNYVARSTTARYARARRVCDGCPFLDHCREYAIAHEAAGVWGGTSHMQRERIRRERGWLLVEAHDIASVFTRDVIKEWQHDTRESAA